MPSSRTFARENRAFMSRAVQARDSDEFARLAFSGLEVVPPGVVLVSEWRPEETGPRPTPAKVNCYGGVGRKPDKRAPN
jgi:S-adenosyl methyltransferase